MEKPVREQASREICRRLFPLATSGQRILAFWPLSSEPDIAPLLEDWLNNGIIVCLPLIKDNALTPLAVNDFQGLLDPAFGVCMPNPQRCEEVVDGRKVPATSLPLYPAPGQGDRESVDTRIL